MNHPECLLLGAYSDDVLVAIGAAKLVNDYAELKRFFVTKDFRGTGVAECILSVLEMETLKKDITNIYLETGVHQKSALKFYENLGYTECEPFGQYTKDPLSVFMNKNVGECEFVLNDSQDSYYVVAFSSQLNQNTPHYSDVADNV